MNGKVSSLIVLLLWTATTYAQHQVEVAFPGLSFTNPVDLQDPRDGTNRLFVVEQAGVIKVFANSFATTSSRVFLDIRSRIRSGGEMGLLGLAFHPNFRTNGFFFINYTWQSDSLRTNISRFRVSATNPDSADPSSEVVLLTVTQPFTNHNGGQLSFGPDGYLYIALGDGGSGGDPLNNAQNLRSLLGKILRIDVNTPTSSRNYGIPPDNPFMGNTQGYREEIYAYGLRNPWRFSFDPPTGRLWAGDVGQVTREEIDIIEKGKNYGWRIMEGSLCYNPPSGCNTAGLELPVWEYGRTLGISVTGGFVYRGSRNPELVGAYVYGDFGSGRIWSLRFDGSSVVNVQLLQASFQISSFGIDANNELYICGYNTGRIYRFQATATSASQNSLVPTSYQLFQNYPNPFNPATVIRYSLPNVGTRYDVSLRVYNVFSQEVVTFANETKAPGQYQVSWDATGFPSGVYWYRFRANEFTETRQMILLK
ncbi:MAG TPA: PQQ-dependent sugar dehydrogenase [Bacteroidota bacterium]|nr:PQQ-dependent sugar dehydrogenase [Bacteroidota bacterium]